MKFYLIDDDKNVLHILKRIIRDRGLGEIAGTAENGGCTHGSSSYKSRHRNC